MQYVIRHITRFSYESPIRESRMEVRMCPRTESEQQCYSFDLDITPHAQVHSYQDYMGNTIHHFDIPDVHDELTLTSRALVEVRPKDDLPEAVGMEAWEAIEAIMAGDAHLEMVLPSAYARPTQLLHAFIAEHDIARTSDPLTLLRRLNGLIYEQFDYSPQSTHAHSPIDDALKMRSGVCQDFAHIFISLARHLFIPCRYVSGYLFHRPNTDQEHNRSAEDGSHAWVEAYIPGLDWVGFDPTNNTLADDRHIRVAIGRDYVDVPPTRGVYKGSARSTLHVGVSVARARFPVREAAMPQLALVVQPGDLNGVEMTPAERLQQQQQQQ
ncbi:MAG: transglutaminase family protein [Rhodothermales bacterium]